MGQTVTGSVPCVVCFGGRYLTINWYGEQTCTRCGGRGWIPIGVAN